MTPTNNLVTRGDGGTATFAVVLHSSPATNVHIQLTSSDPALGRPTPATLTFRSTDWHLPQTVTVTGGTRSRPARCRTILLSPVAAGMRPIGD